MAKKFDGKFTSEYNPAYNLTPEEHKKQSSRGGKKSGEVKREKKMAKEILEVFLSMPLRQRKTADVEKIQAFEQLKGKNITVAEAIQLKQVQRALNGDLNSATYIRDTVGEKPVEKVEAKVENPFKDLTTEELRELIKHDPEGDN